MRVEPLGESAAIVRELGCPGYEIAEAIRTLGLSRVTEIVPSYDTVGIVFEPESTSIDDLRTALQGLKSVEQVSGTLHRVPVCYDQGEDLDSVCTEMNMTRAEFIKHHSGTVYRCYAVGFVPGFAYLGYLPEGISKSVRRSRPRIHVPKGSVGIAGPQTGIYPTESPGGWQLIGWTPTEIKQDSGFLIAPGDQVQFVPASTLEVGR